MPGRPARSALTSAPGIDWSRVEVFHLDEYVGLPSTHPASFRKYLFERLIHKAGITRYHLLDGDGDPQGSVTRIGTALQSKPVDILFAGIGENGHLAFNDPPAFEHGHAKVLVHRQRQELRLGIAEQPLRRGVDRLDAPGGIELSTLTQAESARPFTLTTPVGDRAVVNGVKTSLDQVRGTPYIQIDLRVSRPIKLGDRASVTPFAEFFNLFNHVNFANPISNLNAVTSFDPNTGQVLNPDDFGRIISTSNNPRLIQLALNLNF